eukprot:TRINITY_DN3393_c0_g1_i4.p1 TRINITY_DN3393_c0_g1~~TRINITY_DN3393_c0_g1_i4.p1  ORF type:complete len:551 (-),score=139.30 TRINITY_DN3393_c0_g1_i4:252-1904(-)
MKRPWNPKTRRVSSASRTLVDVQILAIDGGLLEVTSTNFHRYHFRHGWYVTWHPLYHLVKWKGDLQLTIPAPNSKATRQAISRRQTCLVCGIGAVYDGRYGVWRDGCIDSIRWVEPPRSVHRLPSKNEKRRSKMQSQMEHLWLLPSKAPDFPEKSHPNEFFAWISRFNESFPSFKFRRWLKWRSFVPEILDRAFQSKVPETQLQGIEMCFKIRSRCQSSPSEDDIKLEHFGMSTMWMLLRDGRMLCASNQNRAIEFIATSFFCQHLQLEKFQVEKMEFLNFLVEVLEQLQNFQLEDSRDESHLVDDPSLISWPRIHLRNRLMGTDRCGSSDLLVAMARIILTSLSEDQYADVLIKQPRLYKFIFNLMHHPKSDDRTKLECAVLLTVQSEWDDVYFPLTQKKKQKIRKIIQEVSSCRYLPSKKDILRCLEDPISSNYVLSASRENSRKFPAVPCGFILKSLTDVCHWKSMKHHLDQDLFQLETSDVNQSVRRQEHPRWLSKQVRKILFFYSKSILENSFKFFRGRLLIELENFAPMSRSRKQDRHERMPHE